MGARPSSAAKTVAMWLDETFKDNRTWIEDVEDTQKKTSMKWEVLIKTWASIRMDLKIDKIPNFPSTARHRTIIATPSKYLHFSVLFHEQYKSDLKRGQGDILPSLNYWSWKKKLFDAIKDRRKKTSKNDFNNRVIHELLPPRDLLVNFFSKKKQYKKSLKKQPVLLKLAEEKGRRRAGSRSIEEGNETDFKDFFFLFHFTKVSATSSGSLAPRVSAGFECVCDCGSRSSK